MDFKRRRKIFCMEFCIANSHPFERNHVLGGTVYLYVWSSTVLENRRLSEKNVVLSFESLGQRATDF